MPADKLRRIFLHLMATLLFPGRHLLTTAFQEQYVRALLGLHVCDALGANDVRNTVPPGQIDRVVFAITSANQEHSRYNPLAFATRAIGVDRFARGVVTGAYTSGIYGVPDYGHTDHFAEHLLKEVRDASEGREVLTPENCVVLCSTDSVIELFSQLGFSVLTAERASGAATPIELVRRIVDVGEGWLTDTALFSDLSAATTSILYDFPEIVTRIVRMYSDPLLTESGALTESRNYNIYARGMDEITTLKYADIGAAIRPGRIVDEGCADGALLVEVAKHFPDSDLYGVDIAAEFAARFQERQRCGDFRGNYTHFFQRNLMEPIFDPGSIDTTICNSTLHEIWSYNDQEKSVREYLALKFAQLRRGARLVVRDVVAPDNPDEQIVLECRRDDGVGADTFSPLAAIKAEEIASLCTDSRFHLFLRDFLAERANRGYHRETRSLVMHLPDGEYRLPMWLAAEFLSKMDYCDNWRAEMNEEFCVWPYRQWKAALSDAGFRVVESPTESRRYTNEWLAKNRFARRALVRDTQTGNVLPWPATHMVLVAER